MRVGHFVHQLKPFGTERMIEALLKFWVCLWCVLFVVCYEDGPMRPVFERLGARVRISRDDREIARWMREADLENDHQLAPHTMPKGLAGRIGRPKIVTIHWAISFAGVQADRFIATSPLAKEVQPDGMPCELVPNGIDLERYPERTQSSRRVIGRVSRADKCDESFWYALLPILAEFPDVEVHLAGVTSTSGGRVKCLGVCDNVSEVLSEMSLFVYTPRPRHGTKDLAVMEALAAGLPCVFSDVDTVRASVGSEEVAMLVPFHDVRATVEALRFLLHHPAQAEELGRKARAYAHRVFDVRPCVAAYERLYSEVARCA